MKINNSYRVESDAYQWILVETYEGKPGKDGKCRPQERRTYHATLSQACEAVLEREAKHCPDADFLQHIMDGAVFQISEAIKGAA